MGKNEVPKHQSAFTLVRSIFSFSLLLSCTFSHTTHFDNQHSAADCLRVLICSLPFHTQKWGERDEKISRFTSEKDREGECI
jgi:hypothetical protein